MQNSAVVEPLWFRASAGLTIQKVFSRISDVAAVVFMSSPRVKVVGLEEK